VDEVTYTGMPIKMPIGDDIKGRLFNVIGEAMTVFLSLRRAIIAYPPFCTSL